MSQTTAPTSSPPSAAFLTSPGSDSAAVLDIRGSGPRKRVAWLRRSPRFQRSRKDTEMKAFEAQPFLTHSPDMGKCEHYFTCTRPPVSLSDFSSPMRAYSHCSSTSSSHLQARSAPFSSPPCSDRQAHGPNFPPIRMEYVSRLREHNHSL